MPLAQVRLSPHFSGRMNSAAPRASLVQTLGHDAGAAGVSPVTAVVGLAVAVLVAVAYRYAFPQASGHPVDVMGVVREGANFLGVLGLTLWARRDIAALNAGLALLLLSLWMEVVGEFTPGPHWIGTTVPAAMAIVGLVMVTVGIREAARERARIASEKTRAEEELQRSHATLHAVVNGSPDAVWVKDLGGAYLLANQACADQLGMNSGSLIGRRDAELLPPDVAERHVASDREAVQGHAVRYEDSQPPDGSRRTFLVSKGLVRDEHGEPFGILGIARDISDRKAVEERLAHQATHDALTGLPNRAAFLDRLSRELTRTVRQPRHQLAVLFLDVDQFKDVNDRLGHAAGDEVLGRLAELLPQWVRPGDSVARFGGDEFTILLQEVDGVAQAVQVAERVLRGLQMPLPTSHGDIRVAVSIGVALSASSGPLPEDLIRAADTAMYRAKTSGGARHSVYLAPLSINQNQARAGA